MITTNEMIDDFLANIRAAENTKARYGTILRVYAKAVGHLPESDREANSYLLTREAMGKAKSTLSVELAACRRWLRWRDLPVTHLAQVTVTMHPPAYLSRSEIRALLNACESELARAIIALCYDSGARIGEIIGLAMSDVDLENGYIHVVRKGGRPEQVHVSPWGMEYLESWLGQRRGNHNKLFGDWTYAQIRTILAQAAKRAGLEHWTPHMLRHSRAVHLREAGIDWETIAYQLGHVNASQTINIYGRLTAEDLKRQIPAPDLDKT